MIFRWWLLANINRTPPAQDWRGMAEMEPAMTQDPARLPGTDRRAYYRLLDITNIRSKKLERTAAGHPSQARRESGASQIAAEGLSMMKEAKAIVDRVDEATLSVFLGVYVGASERTLAPLLAPRVEASS